MRAWKLDGGAGGASLPTASLAGQARLFTGDVLCLLAAGSNLYSGGADGSVRRYSVSGRVDADGTASGELAAVVSADTPHSGRVQARHRQPRDCQLSVQLIDPLRVHANSSACCPCSPQTQALGWVGLKMSAAPGILLSAGRSGDIIAHDPCTLARLGAVEGAHGQGVAINAVAAVSSTEANAEGGGIVFTGGADGAVCAWKVHLLGGKGGGEGAAVSVSALGRWEYWMIRGGSCGQQPMNFAEQISTGGDGGGGAAADEADMSVRTLTLLPQPQTLAGEEIEPPSAAHNRRSRAEDAEGGGGAGAAGGGGRLAAAGGASEGGGASNNKGSSCSPSKSASSWRLLCGFADGTAAVIETTLVQW